MSISQLLQPNSYGIYVKSVNDIQTEEISPSNENGQVLTIVDKNNKTVAFVDPQDSTPPTLGEPDGYVLSIKNNVTGELEWKQDAQGSIPDPLVLSGADNANKFQVKNSVNDNLFTVDTLNDTITLDANIINLNSSDVVIVNGVNQSQIQTSSGGVFISGADVAIEGSDSKDKFIVKNNAGDSDFVVGTQSGDVSCLIRGGEVTQKLNVTDAGGKSMILCDTLNKDLISVGSLKLGDILTSQIYLETSNTNETVNIKGDDNTSKLRVGRLNGNDMLRVDSVGNNVFVGGGSNNSAFINDINSAQFRVSSNTPPSLNLSAIGVFASYLQISCGASTNSIETNNPLNISSTNDLSLLGNTSQLALQTGNMLFIEDTTVPTKNHIEIRYNSIVSKGNPLSQTSTIDMYPATDDVSFHRRNQDQISVYANPVSDAINFPLTLTLSTDTINWTEIPFNGFSWTNNIASNFVIEPITNRVQYTGTISRTFMIVFEICADTAATDQMIQLCMYKTNTTGTIPTNELEAESFSCFFTKDNPKTGGTCITFKHTVNQNEYLNFCLRTPRTATSIDILHGIKIQAIEL